jgi:hypothetical protein
MSNNSQAPRSWAHGRGLEEDYGNDLDDDDETVAREIVTNTHPSDLNLA